LHSSVAPVDTLVASAMKTLHLLRHTKSDWSDPSVDDFARPLNRRGKRARKLIARHVAGWQIDLMVCSPAKRARATARPLIGVLGCPVRYDEEMYGADADDLLVITCHLLENTSSVMFVGHNPTAAFLCHLLDDGEGDPEAVSGLLKGFPPGAVALLELNVPWTGLGPETGRVTDFYVGQS